MNNLTIWTFQYASIVFLLWLALAIQFDFLAVQVDPEKFLQDEDETPYEFLKRRRLAWVTAAHEKANGTWQSASQSNLIHDLRQRLNDLESEMGVTFSFNNIFLDKTTEASSINPTKTNYAATRYRSSVVESAPVPRDALFKGLNLKSDQKSPAVDSNQLSKYIIPKVNKKLKRMIRRVNEEQLIRNEHQFGSVENDTTIILIQVHKRLDNLKYLVKSLAKVRGIDKSLVIFSHDFWDPKMNTFVASITFFRTLQIFFPFSVQLYPDIFPGTDPRDCERNLKRKKGTECNNLPWSDTFGHYREVKFTQIKHHWWWKIRRVFEDLKLSKYWNGWAIFLEEDHYVAPDLLYILDTLRRDHARYCSTCKVICLGNYKKNVPTGRTVQFGDWIVTQHNLGYAFNRFTWNSIKECGDVFCTFDDYNWDWSLNRLIQTCIVPKLSALYIGQTRVAHVGSCGTHVKSGQCNVLSAIDKAEYSFSKYSHQFFKDSFVIQGSYKTLPKFKKPNGGWGDYRDRRLCKAIGRGYANDTTIAQLQFHDNPQLFKALFTEEE